MNLSTATPIRLFLIKSGPGSGTSIAHKGGYALYGNPPRWRKITAEAPTPKGAPIAAHPKSAGHHAAAEHFTAAQWSALKLPDSNVNAPVFNKALDKLKSWADAGDVTAIVGASYGSNTYGKKLASVANHLLGLHGSAHLVVAGQKPGTHAASQVAEPTDPHPTGLPEHLAPKPEAPPVAVADAAPAGFKVGQKVTIDPALQHLDAGKSGEVVEVKNFGGDNHYIVKIDGGDKEPFQGGELSRAASPAAPPASKALYDAMAKDGEWSELESLLAADSGLKESVKDYISGLLASKPAPAEPIEIKSKADGTPLKPTVPAFTSTLADIENWIADGNKLQLQDAVLNLAGLQSVSAKAAHAFANAGVRFLDKKDEAASAAAQAQPATGGGLAEKPAFDHIAQSVASKKKHSLPSQKTFHKLAAQDWMAANPDKGAEMYEALAAHKLSHLAAAVGPGVHPAAEPEPAASPAAAPASKLDAIPWSNLMLPDTNSNAPGHNKAIAKIKAMAYAGDTAGLGLIVASKSAAKQTYAKKQGLIAQTALAALSEGAPPATPAPASEPAPAPLVGGLNPDTKAMLDDFASAGEWKKVAKVAGNSSNPGAKAYAEKLIKEKPAAKPTPAPVPAAAVPPMEASTPAGGKVYVDAPLYENTIDGHNKFWSVSTYGSVMTTQHGKIGTKGNETVKTFGSPETAKAEAVKLMGQKKAKGYQHSGFAEHTYGVDTGPKEGDTKAGAGGTLVFKDGHWTLQDDGSGWSYSASNPGLSGAPAIEFEKDGKGYYVAKDETDGSYQFGVVEEDQPLETDTLEAADLASLVAQIKEFGHPMPDASALKKLDPSYKPAPASPAPAKPAAIKKLSLIDINTAIQTVTPGQSKFSTNNAAKLAAASAKAGDAEGIKKAYKLASDVGYNKTAKHIAAVAKAMGVIIPEAGASSGASAAPAPAAAPAPVSIGGAMVMDGWAQTGGQGGSNPGGKFKDDAGQEWYCKFPQDADTAKSEILAAKLYALAGLAGQDAMLVSKGGKVGLASKWVNVKKAASATALSKVDGVKSGFVVDAWLGNWDVVGMGNDNLQVGPDGKAHRVDAGGSLEYRAQGEKKPFGHKVEELETMLNAGMNPHSAAVFKSMTKADLTASAAKVLAISDVAIRAMVNQHGPGDAAAKEKLIATLIARKKDIAAKFPAAVKKKKEVKFDASKISAPPSFLNWGGSGKSGPSSKEFLNQANEDAVQVIFSTAKMGSIKQVEGLTAKVYNKDTGQVTGEAPVLSHPSQHVKGYAQQAVNEINYQLNPPKVFRFDGGHPLHSLNAAYPAFTGPASSSIAQKLGKFIVLGEPGMIGLQDVGLPPKLTHTEAGGTMSTMTFAKQAQASMAQMPATQKQAIKSYTGSSYHAMNGSLWSGNPSGAAKAAGEALKTLGHEITPGTVLSRKISLHGADLQSLLGASGKILQEPAIMSTSIRPSSWSGNVHLKLHIGPGVKGLWVGHHSMPGGGALSSHSGEDEMILPPGTRLMILSVKSGSDSDGFGKSSAHIVEAIVLPTQ